MAEKLTILLEGNVDRVDHNVSQELRIQAERLGFCTPDPATLWPYTPRP